MNGDESKASAMCEKTKWSGPPPRSHITVSMTSPSGRAAIRPLTASSSKSGFPWTSSRMRASRIPAPASSEPSARTSGKASARDRREGSGPVDLAGELPSEE